MFNCIHSGPRPGSESSGLVHDYTHTTDFAGRTEGSNMSGGLTAVNPSAVPTNSTNTAAKAFACGLIAPRSPARVRLNPSTALCPCSVGIGLSEAKSWAGHHHQQEGLDGTDLGVYPCNRKIDIFISRRSISGPPRSSVLHTTDTLLHGSPHSLSTNPVRHSLLSFTISSPPIATCISGEKITAHFA